VWSDERWRLTLSSYRAIRGFCYLEPKRHIEYITELDGVEAKEFGAILAKASRAIKSALDAKLVYVYIYGGHIPHLHAHLAPHTVGDVFVDDVIRSGIEINEDIMKPGELVSMADKIKKNL
jgi:diadenosine tetraphosphate (Ap4A) HIT family hydrolase